ncbi:MAG: sigma-54-dependent Fis family transcriptional regulator [Deltaproteobacteria bacterium]|nr:sigma-54-dependent Fis family transcriptional regulator [Deltaproteobacteria bacterium]
MMQVLVVDDDETLRLTVRMALEPFGHKIEEAADGLEAVEKVSDDPQKYDAVLLDVNMPRMNGIQALQTIREMNPRIFCLILTAHSDVKDAVLAIKHGAYDYVEKPVEAETILSLMESARDASALVEAAAFSAPLVEFAEGNTMIGSSSEIKHVFNIIYKLSKVDTSVLIRGESGSGKELVARAIHFNSARRKGPFVPVNCAAIPDNLIESELFGHEKGAFTGADRRKIGKFQFAEGGTIFLDEIGDISSSMQVKLLRVLQEKVVSPVGLNQEIEVDTRIVAATNRPLEQLIKDGSFRSDLFYRLNVLPITLPPLRDRREDIPPLAEFMIKKFNKAHSRNILKLSKEAMNALRMYNWPGNIRELENVIEHAFILENSEVINLSSLPEKIVACLSETGTDSDSVPHQESQELLSEVSTLNYPALKERFEREFIIRALKAFAGRINQTAAHTKMTKVTLLRKLEKYGINAREYYRD